MFTSDFAYRMACLDMSMLISQARYDERSRATYAD
jgi:hypothetical protein